MLFTVLLSLLAATGPGWSQTVFRAEGTGGPYRLRHVLLVVGSDSVFAEGHRLSAVDYSLDYEHGLIRFDPALAVGTEVRVDYRTVSFTAIRSEYRLHVAVPAGTTEAGNGVRARDFGSTWTPDSGALDISGNKSVGFSIGGIDGTGITQSTQLAVSGVIEGVEIQAEISDQSTPIPPEGTTLELEELDRIAIDLRGNHWQGTFGDVEMEMGTEGFGSVRRRAVGGLVGADVGPVGLTVGYARPRGQFARVVLPGITGMQGPYVLAPDGRAATIVPGTEEVYLDGSRMTRGWDADYTVDYSTGEVVFTTRNLVSRESRIEASFQYVTEAYERAGMLAGVEFAAGSFGLGVGLFREGDDPTRDYAHDLTEEDREYLAGIGGDTARAWLDGADYVGAGMGSYVRDSGFYRYVGEDKGNYRVQFTLLGDSLGDYVYDDTLFGHHYVGVGAGNYAARVRVQLPEREELVQTHAGYRRGGLAAGASGLFRRRMRNLFTPGGAGAVDGAGGLNATWHGERLGVTYAGRMLSAGFQYPGGDSLVGFEHRWGGVASDEARHVNEVEIELRPLSHLCLTGAAGLLGTAADSNVYRYSGELEAGWFGFGAGRFGPETRLEVDVDPAVGWFRPSAGWRFRAGRSGGGQAWQGRMGVVPRDGLEAGIGYTYDIADTTDSIGISTRSEQGGLARADLVWRAGDVFRLEGRVAHQDRYYSAVTGVDWRMWLGNALAVVTPRAGLRLQFDASQVRRLLQLRDELFRYVGPEQGDYARDTLTGRYYYDPDGEYERIVVASGTFVPAQEQVLTSAVDWSAWRPLAVSGSFSRSLVSDTVVLQESRAHNARLTVRGLEPWLIGHLGTDGSASFDRTLSVTGRAAERYRYYIEASSRRVPRVDLRARLEYGTETRRDRTDTPDYEETNWSGELVPVIGTRLRLEVTAAVEYAVIAEPVTHPELGRFTLTTVRVDLGRNWTIRHRTRLHASVGIVQRRASISELPFDVSLARPLGRTPSAAIRATHMFNDILTASVHYAFLDRPDRAADHQFTAELRAFF